MQRKFTNKEYEKYVEQKMPKSKIFRNIARAFVVGGFICIVGQFFASMLEKRGLEKTTVSNLTSLIMIFIGILLTGLNLYDNIGKFAGAGSIVPITGFANSIVSPAMEYKSEGYVLGIGARMFLVAGPVLVYGISASVIAGIIYFLLGM